MESDLSLYVHWPFCVSKCPYCDFNSHAAPGIDQARWRDALLTDLAHAAAEAGPRRLVSIFFGGGTPSLMAPETAADVIDAATHYWRAADDIEITAEANPNSSDAGRFAALHEAGVNRLSVGVQSFDDSALAFLGRTHGAAEARRAVELAAATFPRFSFDLIYARPGQSVESWTKELAQALEFAPRHLSVYQLTIEPGTEFARRGVSGADEDTAIRLYEITQEKLAAAGLPAYEISNHAAPNEACRHNLEIWRGGDYAGVGPGAHGRLSRDGTTVATRQLRDPARWLAAVEEKGPGGAPGRVLDPRARAEELLLLGLRTVEGVDRARFAARCGVALDDAVRPGTIDELVEGGFLEIYGAAVRATAEGRLRLNAVLSRLLA